ncbi:MAG: PHP domain-containing protein [Bacteroidales bacterium]|nr:MAG: PHP domain-containing protein [Bacteroidales bacterium]
MKCDFHVHTVFSDGVVWPTVRVDEALAEGLDAIAITEHVEWHRVEVIDDNRISYEIARDRAEGSDLVIIPGGEISASPDHFNALFLEDPNDRKLKDTIPARRIAAANAHGGFVFWNHPGWTAKYKNGNTPVTEEFKNLLRDESVQGIEVCNGNGYWEGALKLALEYDLALLGNSDIHGVSYNRFEPGKHRTVTLVFAKEKSAEGIRDALLDKRTAIYQGDHLIGPVEFLKPLFFESLELEATYREGTTIAYVSITNNSDINFYCGNRSPFLFYNSTHFFTIKAHSTTILGVKVNKNLPEFELDLVIHNLVVAPGESLELSLPVIMD